MERKLIAIANDHAGFEKKKMILVLLKSEGFIIKDFGSHSSASVDYPDFVHPVASAVNNGEANVGILLCGTANGVAMTANKYPKVRAAICWNEPLAMLARQHNDANILCLPARFIDMTLTKKIAFTFLQSTFDHGRHYKRINKINP